MVFSTSKFFLMPQNLNLKAKTTTPILSRVSAFHILVLYLIELRGSSARTTSKSITARTKKSIKSCFPTKTRQTRIRSQVSIVSHVNADWFTLQKPDAIWRSDKNNITTAVSKKSAINQRSLSMLGCAITEQIGTSVMYSLLLTISTRGRRSLQFYSTVSIAQVLLLRFSCSV